MTDLPNTADQVRRVTTFHDLVSTPFSGEVNALCWQRKLVGDFSEIVDKVELDENMTTLSEEVLRELPLSPTGQLAREVVLQDLELLKNHGAAPTINVIKSYEQDDSFMFFPTDVYSWHVDRSTVPTDTFLCTYHGEASDILPNAQATQKVLIPEIREKLQELCAETDEGFESFLSEYFFDLHYQAKPAARPVSLGLGHIWRLAIDHPESQVLPCIHRAPREKNGQHRLLLIC